MANPPTPGPVLRSPLLFATTKPHEDKCDRLTRSLCPAPSRAGLRNISRHKASLTINRTSHTTTNPLSPSTLDTRVRRRRIQPLPLPPASTPSTLATSIYKRAVFATLIPLRGQLGCTPPDSSRMQRVLCRVSTATSDHESQRFCRLRPAE